MALTSASTITDAIAQYNNSLRYWEDAATANNLAEACVYLLRADPVNLTAAGRSFSRESLEKLRDQAIQFAQSASANRAPLFSRGRVGGMGRW